jgi:hypothetical protein
MKRIFWFVLFSTLLVLSTFNGFASATTYDFNAGLDGFSHYGDASASQGSVLLTPAINWKGGSIFLQNSYNATHFSASFDFLIGGGSGADGLTFAWVNSPGLGNLGGSIGFDGLSGYAVEFDTWNNDAIDNYSGNHIGVNKDSVFNSIAMNTTIPLLADSHWHHSTISFDNGILKVSMDGVEYINTPLTNYQMQDAFFGFTSATGGSNNNHSIDNFTFTNQPQVPEPATFILFGIGLTGFVTRSIKKKISWQGSLAKQQSHHLG